MQIILNLDREQAHKLNLLLSAGVKTQQKYNQSLSKTEATALAIWNESYVIAIRQSEN